MTICLNLAELQQQASESLKKGEYSTAITIYEQCIEAEPADLANYWQLGLATLLHGDEMTAQAIWMSVLIQGDSAEYDEWTAELSYLLKQEVIRQTQCGNLLLAEKICFLILELVPSMPEVYYYLGICSQQRKEVDDAIDYLKKEIEINPEFANAYSSLGALLRDKFCGEIEQPIKYIEKALELKPDFPEAHFNMGACLHTKGEFDRAIEHLGKAIELKPDFAEAYYSMGLYFWNQGKTALAISKIQAALAFNPGLHIASRALNCITECKDLGYAPVIGQGYNFWDAMIFKDGELYRLYYLLGKSSARPFWSVGQLAAAISTDLRTWEYLGVVFEPDPISDWQSGRILAGSLYKENGIYYFFYAAAPPQPRTLEENIGLATSTDGITWQRRAEPFLRPDPQFYCTSLREGTQIHHGWRDPYIFKDPVTSKYYLFITSSCYGPNPAFQGCIGLAVADKIDGPYTVLPPVAYPKVPGTEEGIHYEMERPQVFYRNGLYHLFFSASTLHLNPKWVKQVGREQVTNCSLYWYVSESITGPFIPSSAKPVVPGSESTDLYGTSFIEAPDGQLVACGTHPGTSTLEVSTRFPVHWENSSVKILLNKGFQSIPA